MTRVKARWLVLALLLLTVGALATAACSGPTGPGGPPGAPGQPGPAGATGPQGPQGVQGVSGAQGLAGAAGKVGATGPSGPAGVAGPAGLSGLPGATGPAGATPSGEAVQKAVAEALAGKAPAKETLALGGRLYDNWISETKATAPAGNQPMWALQTTNTRTGNDTWRCKECHGWDYKGKGGAYGKGSHYTGFPGVINAATALSRDQLVAVMKGANDYRHDFAVLLGDKNLEAVVDFLKWGPINETGLIDYATKKPIGANAANGKSLYDGTCAACHGADGRTLNFGSAAAPEYVGTLAKDNPWEFVNKVRFGQPGAPMPAGVVTGWTTQQVMDVLGHAQTLPDK